MLDLIGQTYDAAVDPTRWTNVADDMARIFNSGSGVVQLQNHRTGKVGILSRTDNLHDRALDDYRAHYWSLDIWVERAKKFGLGRVVTSKDLVCDDELERTEFWQDWSRKVDQFYILGALLGVGDGEYAGIGIHRPRQRGPYDEDDRTRLSVFLPHLARALQIRRHLDAPALATQAAFEALERSRTGAIVVGRGGRIFFANPLALRYLRAGDAISAPGGRISVRGRRASERLLSLIEGAIETAEGRGVASGGVLGVARVGRLPLGVAVAPFPPAGDAGGMGVPAALLLLKDPEEPTPSSVALQDLFGLTAAEALVAQRLAKGQSVDEIASAVGVTVHTVRTQVKCILAKTGTGRQAELVALVLRSVATLSPST